MEGKPQKGVISVMSVIHSLKDVYQKTPEKREPNARSNWLLLSSAGAGSAGRRPAWMPAWSQGRPLLILISTPGPPCRWLSESAWPARGVHSLKDALCALDLWWRGGKLGSETAAMAYALGLVAAAQVRVAMGGNHRMV